MPIPEKKSQDKLPLTDSHEDYPRKIVREIRSHNFLMSFIALILLVCGLGVLIFLDSMARVLKEILELIN